MPLVVQLGEEAGVERIAVLLGVCSSSVQSRIAMAVGWVKRLRLQAFACSTACALPMTSFPNVAPAYLGAAVVDTA